MRCPGAKPEVTWVKRSRSSSWNSINSRVVMTLLKTKETNQRIKHPKTIWTWHELLQNFKLKIILLNIGNETLMMWIGECSFFMRHSHLEMLFKNSTNFICKLEKIAPSMRFVLKRVLKLPMIIGWFVIKFRWNSDAYGSFQILWISF